MEKFYQSILVLLLFILANNIHADTYTAVKDGKWEDPTTWGTADVPNLDDDVIISGFTVIINNATGNVDVNHLLLKNMGALDSTVLHVNEGVVLNITTSLEAYLNNNSQLVQIKLQGESTVNIGGNVIMERLSDNSNTKKLELKLWEQAMLNIGGNLNYTYGKGSLLESSHEIVLYNKSQIMVAGNMNLSLNAGASLIVETKDSSKIDVAGFANLIQDGGAWLGLYASDQSEIETKKDVYTTNNGGLEIRLRAYGYALLDFQEDVFLDSKTKDKDVSLKASSAGKIDIAGDITFLAVDQADAVIELNDNSEMLLAGSFIRPSNYGAFLMDDGATLVFDGSTSQFIPSDEKAGNGTDKFSLTNVEFNNSSGVPILLESTMTINSHLNLNNGIIQTNAATPLVIASGATIDPGSPDSYIDGPIIKQGLTNGTSFVFPTGDDDVYAPIEISALTDPNDQITVQYYYDPPPIREEGLATGLDHISGIEYWDLTQESGTTTPEVTLYWEDAQRSGMDDLSSLTVAFYDSTSRQWIDLGNGGTTGGVGEGVSGTIISAAADPPPIREEGRVTFGATVSGSNSLPVELMMFKATPEGGDVILEWMTGEEINMDHFMVERGMDGANFKPLSKKDAKGVINRTQNYYESIDEHPMVGRSYYRIKMVEEDGSFTYSNVSMVNFSLTGQVMVYPNPVFDIIHVNYGDEIDEEVIIEIFNQQGQVIYRGKHEMMEGELMLSAPRLNISVPGSYILSVYTGEGVQSFKFIKSP